jgi:CheY-like chemotaxis protein
MNFIQMKKTILIAEDEDIGRFTISLMLENDFNLIFAENGKQAVDKFFNNNPDLLLLDLGMPDIDGFEVLAEIKKRGDGRETKVIAVTGRTMNGEVKMIMESGFDDFISKPIDVDVLLQKIDKHIK